MKQARIYLLGSVQGVGYRYFVKSWAKTFGVSGWVRNLSDGRVEAVFQGEKRAIEGLIVKCRKGPFLVDMKDIKVLWEEAKEEFGDFQIF